MSLIRGTSLQGFVELVDELGGDPDALLARAHLVRGSVGDHESFIDYRSVIQVLEAASSATGAGDFGRLLAQRQGLEILGPLGVAARTAATVGDALGAIERYLSVYSPALAVSVEAAPGTRLATFTWQVAADRPPPHRQAAELGLGVSVRVFHLLAGDDFRPVEVHLRHRPLTDPAEYESYFGCRVEFEAEGYGFRLDQRVLSRRLATDGAVHEVVQDYLSSIAVPAETSTTDAVVRLIRRMLPTGSLDLDLVAGQLAQHRRTLQRHLADQGTSFAALVDQVRRDDAERFLRETDMPFIQMAGILGFSEQSAFTRACRRWFGAPPKTVRVRLRS